MRPALLSDETCAGSAINVICLSCRVKACNDEKLPLAQRSLVGSHGRALTFTGSIIVCPWLWNLFGSDNGLSEGLVTRAPWCMKDDLN
jgi:hypothetical protein